MFPKPVQQPHPPIHIGGETTAALAAGRTPRPGLAHLQPVARRSWPTGLAELDAELEAAGRTRNDLHITVCPYFNQLTPEWVEGYAEAGADAVAALFFAFTPDDVARAFDDLEACREAAHASPAPASDGSSRTDAPSTGDARCAACSGRNTPASSRHP